MTIPPARPGPVPLDSPRYVRREADTQLRQCLKEGWGLVVLTGTAQTGNSSLLLRALQWARDYSCVPVWVDFATWSPDLFRTLTGFRRHLIEEIWRQVVQGTGLSCPPAIGSMAKWGKFFAQLEKAARGQRVVWIVDHLQRIPNWPCMEEVRMVLLQQHECTAPAAKNPRCFDIVLAQPRYLQFDFSVFGEDTPADAQGINGLRKGVLPGTLPVGPLSVTDPDIWVPGDRIDLDDFTVEQCAELNERFGGILKDYEELRRFYVLTGGHPFLTHRGLELLSTGLRLENLAEVGILEDGPFSTHWDDAFSGYLSDPRRRERTRAWLQEPASDKSFIWELETLGIITQHGPLRPRSMLYDTYLRRRLLSGPQEH